MSLSLARRERYRKLANRIRRIPGEYGLRPYTVAVVEIDLTTELVTDTVLTLTEDGQPPKVRFLDAEQTVLAGLTSEAIRVGPVTPDHTGGGVSYEDLTGFTLDQDDPRYRLLLTGPKYPSGALYRYRVESDRALHWTIFGEIQRSIQSGDTP